MVTGGVIFPGVTFKSARTSSILTFVKLAYLAMTMLLIWMSTLI